MKLTKETKLDKTITLLSSLYMWVSILFFPILVIATFIYSEQMFIAQVVFGSLSFIWMLIAIYGLNKYIIV